MCERRASHTNYSHESIVKGFPVGITNLKLPLAYDVVLCVYVTVCVHLSVYIEVSSSTDPQSPSPFTDRFTPELGAC